MTDTVFLDFLGRIEALKCNTRHCCTSTGRPESVAEHSWRTAVMALLLEPEFPEVNMNRVLRMCLVHDFGEAVTGDIPTFLKTRQDETTEDRALAGLLGTLDSENCSSLTALFAEMSALKTPEARLYKLLDKLEAVIQHNEAPLSSWEPREYPLQQEYAWKEAAWFPRALSLREEILRRTRAKIETVENEDTTHGN